jgi:hypothetical protein
MSRLSLVVVVVVLSLALTALTALTGCRGGVTQARMETAVARTFANLVATQESIMGLPDVHADALRATATCKRRAAGRDWTCTIEWFIPGRRGLVHDAYEVSVTTDGCYTATSEGAEAHVGGPTVTSPRGEPFTNLLYVFEGCFDTTYPVE